MKIKIKEKLPNILEVDIEVQFKDSKEKKVEKIKLLTSDVIKLAEEKGFKISNIIKSDVLSNQREDRLKGRWIFTVEKEIPEEEKWLFDNKEALGSVKQGIEDAKDGKSVESPHIFNSINFKSSQRRTKTQKENKE